MLCKQQSKFFWSIVKKVQSKPLEVMNKVIKALKLK